MENRKQKRDKLTQYLEQNVSPIIDRLVTELLANMPEDVITWSIDWLNTKGILHYQDTLIQVERLLRCQERIPLLHFSSPRQLENSKTPFLLQSDEQLLRVEGSKDNSQHVQNVARTSRNAVSAEVFGAYNKKEDFKARQIDKTEEELKRIQERLSQAFMFQSLQEDELRIVINAMELKTFKPGDQVIKQGEEGHELYVVDEGKFDCFKVFKKGEQDTFLKTYKEGELFGELALLYNAPRAASITSTTDSVCFALDRETFNQIVKEATIKRREKYEQILSTFTILETLEPYSKQLLTDCLEEINLKDDQVIVKAVKLSTLIAYFLKGEEVTKLYFIAEGNLVDTFGKGDYFGDFELINKVVSERSIVTRGDCQLIAINQEQFKELLGQIEEQFKVRFNK